MLCCTPHTGLLENYFYFLRAGRSTLFRRGDGAAFHMHKFSTIFNVVSGGCTLGSAVACAALAIGVLSTFGEGRRLSTSWLGAQLSSRPAFMAFPSSRREPLSSPRNSKASNMRPLRDYDSLASWTVARRITSRSRSLPTDRIAIGFMSKVDRQRVFHGLASLAEVFAEYLVSRLPHANRFGWSLQSTHGESLGQLGYPRKFQRFVEGIPHICTLWSTTVVMRRHFSSRKADLLSFG